VPLAGAPDDAPVPFAAGDAAPASFVVAALAQ